MEKPDVLRGAGVRDCIASREKVFRKTGAGLFSRRKFVICDDMMTLIDHFAAGT